MLKKNYPILQRGVFLCSRGCGLKHFSESKPQDCHFSLAPLGCQPHFLVAGASLDVVACCTKCCAGMTEIEKILSSLRHLVMMLSTGYQTLSA